MSLHANLRNVQHHAYANKGRCMYVCNMCQLLHSASIMKVEPQSKPTPHFKEFY